MLKIRKPLIYQDQQNESLMNKAEKLNILVIIGAKHTDQNFKNDSKIKL